MIWQSYIGSERSKRQRPATLKKLEDMGQLDDTSVVFTTHNGGEAISYPDAYGDSTSAAASGAWIIMCFSRYHRLAVPALWTPA